MAPERLKGGLERAARVHKHLMEHGPLYTGLAGTLGIPVSIAEGIVPMFVVSTGLTVLSLATGW